MYPQDCRYSKDHEWIRVEGDRGRVGITDYAQKQLGDVVFLELPEPGRALTQGEQFGTVESVKAVSELFSPVAGEVVAVNGDLVSKPEAINKDPHGAAWMIELRITAAAGVSAREAQRVKSSSGSSVRRSFSTASAPISAACSGLTSTETLASCSASASPVAMDHRMS